MAASKLQTSPFGLLQALNLQTLGQAPTLFGDTVVPTLESADWYVTSQCICVGAFNSAAQNTGDSAALQVPVNQAWWVRAAAITLQMVAARTAPDGIGLQLNVVPQGVGVACPLASFNTPPIAALAATRQFASPVHFDRPLILRSGTLLRADLACTLSGTATLGVEILFVPIPL